MGYKSYATHGETFQINGVYYTATVDTVKNRLEIKWPTGREVLNLDVYIDFEGDMEDFITSRTLATVAPAPSAYKITEFVPVLRTCREDIKRRCAEKGIDLDSSKISTATLIDIATQIGDGLMDDFWLVMDGVLPRVLGDKFPVKKDG